MTSESSMGTNPDIFTPKPDYELTEREREQIEDLHDVRIRAVCVPIFGIVIPNLTGLFGPLGPSHFAYWFGYLWFIGLSFCIWQGNRFFLIKQRLHYDWFNHPIRKVVLLLFANVFYTTPITLLFLSLWYQSVSQVDLDWRVIQVVTLMNVICVVFITHVYETVYLIRQREDDLLTVEKLERAKAEAELQALKIQIDPHFMFNSLNTLSELIASDVAKAAEFNENLADVYRYILSNKDRELVPLLDELEFLQAYQRLMVLRFGGVLSLDIQADQDLARLLIPPISLQLLLENTYKHNDLSEPMTATLLIGGNELVFSNPMRPKRIKRFGSRLGLDNLNERYVLITDREITIEQDQGQFTVTLPLLRLTA